MQHVIQYQLFDVAYTNAAKSHDLQNKISDIFNNKLVAGMEALFDRLLPGNEVLSLNEVSIDVGTINYQMLDYNLVDRILVELEHELKYRISIGQGLAEATDAPESLKDFKNNYNGLLEYFLLTGTMPWWATGDLMVDPVKVIEQLLVNDAAGLRTLIVRIGQLHYVRQRLVFQFPDSVIRDIITLLEPTEAEFVFDYHATTVKIHSEKELVESAPNVEFEKALWLFILTYLLVDRGSLFNQKSFIRSTIGQMAQHYNREYAELLSLLTVALNTDALHKRQSGYLPLIIRELSMEEAGQNHQYAKSSNPKQKQDGASIIADDVELIKHFLVFGSLPWWAEPLDVEQLTGIFIGLIKTAPKELRVAVMTAGQNENVRKRIVNTFNDVTITKVVELLEPVNAPFIINYVAEVQQLHIKKVIAKAESNDFRRSVWQFVLDFLIVERGSEFNQLMFLQSNIKKLANNYNIQYRDMLSYFVQSISQLHQSSIEHAPLFKLLTVLLQEDRKDYDAVEATTSEMTGSLKPFETDYDKKSVVALKDLLLYWLQYGVIPWWGREYFDLTPGEMFGVLAKESFDDAILVIKYAATDVLMQKRVIHQLPGDVILNLFDQLPQGNEATKLYFKLYESFTLLDELRLSDHAILEKQLLLILWDSIKISGYTEFDAGAFIQKAATLLSVNYQLSTSVIIKTLKAKLTKAEDKRHNMVLTQIAKDGIVQPQPQDFDTRSKDVFTLIESIVARDKTVTDDLIRTEALKILAYFLANNKLPSQFKGTNPAYINAVVKQLLEFLNQADQSRLKQLIDSNNRTDLYKLLDSGQAVPVIDGGIQQLIVAHLSLDQLSKTDAIVNESLKILTYFLQYAKLPDYLGALDTRLALKQLLVLLNYQNKSALISLLQKGGHSALARMQLHNAFGLPGNTAENNVTNALKVFFEQDALLYIKQLPQTQFTETDKFADILIRYMGQPQLHAGFIVTLLRQPAISRYIAINYDNDIVYTLLSHQSSLVGGNNNLEWIKQVQSFFGGGLTDTLLRDRFNNLFREFNLLIIGGHISAPTPEAYLMEFFRFLSSANSELLMQLSKNISSVDIKKVPAALRITLIKEQLGIQQKADTANHDVKELLNIADEQALKEIIDKNDNMPETLIDEVEKDAVVNTKDTIYIDNAGLVILNPFFATYFVRLGILNAGKFVSIEAQHRAVHLLQYLVNGADETPEHVLVLNKILCNVPIAEPIPRSITINEQEKQVSEELLKAVTERWEKMKNTSISGFQSSFLQRTGALVFKDDAWNLRVEQRGYDVLLQTLPWNIGMIKTPWMDNFLYVEWI
jgi:hypothetical protein